MNIKEQIIYYLFSKMKIDYDKKEDICYFKISRHNLIEFEKMLEELLKED